MIYLTGHAKLTSATAELSEVQHLSVLCPEAFPTNTIPLPFHLQSLRLYFDGAIDILTFSLSILFNSFESLSTLHLFGVTHPTALAHLIAFLDSTPLQNLHSLVLEAAECENQWLALVATLPSLTSFEIRYFYPSSFAAVGTSALPTLEVLKFTSSLTMEQSSLAELYLVVQQPNLAGLRRIEIPTVPRTNLEKWPGTAMMDKCERRGISVLCQYGYVCVSPARRLGKSHLTPAHHLNRTRELLRGA